MHITHQLINKVRSMVINQARYTYPSDMARITDEVNDAMYVAAEDMTDDDTLKFIEGKAIMDDNRLLHLVETMGVEELYSEAGWIDPVADYIMDNRTDCYDLWNHLMDISQPVDL